MITIVTVDDTYFTLNGIQYARIFQPLNQGGVYIGIIGVYDSRQVIQKPELYSSYSIDGVVYTTFAETFAALHGVIFNISAGTGGSVTVDSALSTTSSNPVQNKIVTAAINTNIVAIEANAASIEQNRQENIVFETAGETGYILRYYDFKVTSYEGLEGTITILTSAGVAYTLGDTVQGGDYLIASTGSDNEFVTFIVEAV